MEEDYDSQRCRFRNETPREPTVFVYSDCYSPRRFVEMPLSYLYRPRLFDWADLPDEL